jgi:hypothetical protein
MISKIAIAFAVFLWFPAPLWAQASPQPDCRDDDGTDRCAAAEQRRMRDSFGVRSIEEHRDAGDQVWRVFYVDGYGRDLILISFVRAAGRDPMAWVHYPRRDGEPRTEPLQAPVPQAVWDEVGRRSENFDRSFALFPGEDPALRSICLHGWVYVMESAERRRGRSPAPIRRKTESACEDGPGGVFATELQRLTLPLFPHCAALDPEQHRSPATMLAACRLLHGDRLAAAEVLNLAGGFRSLGGSEDAHRLAGRFASETEIDWNGEHYRGAGHRAPAFWIARLERTDSVANFYFERVEAQDANNAVLTGTISRSVDTPQGRSAGHQRARVRQEWMRDFNGDMQIARAMIGPWEAAR